MKAFVAITCSTCRVTNCSTSCAVAPGHVVRITMTLKVNGGSSDCASLP